MVSFENFLHVNLWGTFLFLSEILPAICSKNLPGIPSVIRTDIFSRTSAEIHTEIPAGDPPGIISCISTEILLGLLTRIH